MALTDLFTDIADSIRQKDGTTAQIPAVDFAERILGIPSGNGVSGYRIAIGSFTLESDHPLAINGVNNPFRVTHNLGVVPRFFFLFQPDTRRQNTVIACFIIKRQVSTNPENGFEYGTSLAKINSSSNNTYASNQVDLDSENPENAIVIASGNNSTALNTFYIRSGMEYKWMAIVEG